MTAEIDYHQVAKIACCSSYHFQRMFAYIADMPLPEYIRRRKMSLAAIDLQSGDEKIIDIALKYVYSSPTAFNRAFQSIHGIAPSRAKEDGVLLKSYPTISFKLIAKGVEELEFRIEKKDMIRVLGVSTQLSSERHSQRAHRQINMGICWAMVPYVTNSMQLAAPRTTAFGVLRLHMMTAPANIG